MTKTDLAGKIYWDQYWSQVKLPAEINPKRYNPVDWELIRVCGKFLSVDSEKSIVEIGGAPGKYLSYFAKKYKYKASAIDYSFIGCNKIRENFELLGLDVTVYNTDIQSPRVKLPQFDVVFSFGVIEHFTNYEDLIGKHIELLKPSGILMIGVPHFIYAFARVFKYLAPKTMGRHSLEAIDINNWQLENKKLKTLFKGYVGGFEPMYIQSVIIEEKGKVSLLMKLVFIFINLFGRIRGALYKFIPASRVFQRLNSRYWSVFALGVYKKE